LLLMKKLKIKNTINILISGLPEVKIKIFAYNIMSTLLDFLKKYSTISNIFLEDFFSLYDNKTSENNFVIDLKNVAKWLNVDIKSLR